MKLTTVKELFQNPDQYLDQEVTVGGWVRSLRDSKAFGFIVVSDGSCFNTLQVVFQDVYKRQLNFLLPQVTRRTIAAMHTNTAVKE